MRGITFKLVALRACFRSDTAVIQFPLTTETDIILTRLIHKHGRSMESFRLPKIRELFRVDRRPDLEKIFIYQDGVMPESVFSKLEDVFAMRRLPPTVAVRAKLLVPPSMSPAFALNRAITGFRRALPNLILEPCQLPFYVHSTFHSAIAGTALQEGIEISLSANMFWERFTTGSVTMCKNRPKWPPNRSKFPV